jgi:crotonobetainyl-CoA:carnitine CoA-transferase CaiB-like acyl-CoA transferase
MAGAERVVSTALALLLARRRGGLGASQPVPLEDGARALAEPLHEGLTAPGAILGGGLAGYNLYAAREGWIAVAALEPHFARRLADALGLAGLDAGALRERFAADSAESWQRWARDQDLPIVAVRLPPEETP